VSSRHRLPIQLHYEWCSQEGGKRTKHSPEQPDNERAPAFLPSLTQSTGTQSHCLLPMEISHYTPIGNRQLTIGNKQIPLPLMEFVCIYVR
jgi:hypothetical protein